MQKHTVSQVFVLMHMGSNKGFGTKYRLCKRVYDTSGVHVGYMSLGASGKWRYLNLTRKCSYSPDIKSVEWRVVAEGSKFQVFASWSSLCATNGISATTQSWINGGLLGAAHERPSPKCNGVDFWKKHPTHKLLPDQIARI